MTAKCYIAFLYHVVRCTREYLKSNYPGEEGHPLLMLHVRAPGHLKAGVVEACAAKLGVQLVVIENTGLCQSRTSHCGQAGTTSTQPNLKPFVLSGKNILNLPLWV